MHWIASLVTQIAKLRLSSEGWNPVMLGNPRHKIPGWISMYRYQKFSFSIITGI